ncbi:MAG: hypothetical protein WC861_00705 [Candidatus Micrarchaeia archaeon]|jgi:hypothetical protein
MENLAGERKKLSELVNAHEKCRGCVYGIIREQDITPGWESMLANAWYHHERSTIEMLAMFEKIVVDICSEEKLANKASPVTKTELTDIAFSVCKKLLGDDASGRSSLLNLIRIDEPWRAYGSNALVKAVKEAFDSIRKRIETENEGGVA